MTNIPTSKVTMSRHCSITYFWCPFTVYNKTTGSSVTTANLLLYWVDSLTYKHSVPHFNAIQDESFLLFSDLKRKENQTSADFDLEGSQRWYGTYKKCENRHTIGIGSDKVSTILDMASPFPAELTKKQELPNY